MRHEEIIDFPNGSPSKDLIIRYIKSRSDLTIYAEEGDNFYIGHPDFKNEIEIEINKKQVNIYFFTRKKNYLEMCLIRSLLDLGGKNNSVEIIIKDIVNYKWENLNWIQKYRYR